LRLTDRERDSVREIASTLVEPSKISAIAAYGSKVAGYSRPDSDYDLLVVSRRFSGGVRYKYVDSPTEVSALVIDEHMLHQDATSSFLGEFVVGRLLNVYEPIINGGLFRSVELEYKKRVLTEALIELSSDYGEFATHLLVPYEYFLFDKLHKRAAIYPPALYSYVHTYTCPMGEENKELAVEAFVEAAKSLQPRGFLTAAPEGVRIVPERLKADAFSRFESMFSQTARGVTQYAVHGYAGRVGPSVFSREALSKLRRMRESPPPLTPLEKPRSLLTLEQGEVIPDSSLLVEELARILGFRTYSTKEKDIGEPYSTTRVLTFSENTRAESVVVKNYADVRALKWALLGIWASTAKKFSASANSRLDREYGMTLRLHSMGVLVPRVLAVAPAERILVKEYVTGPTLASMINSFLKGGSVGLGSVSTYGEIIARLHKAGIALGDSKPSNVVVAAEGLYLTDLEQAYPGGDQSWDIAEFLYYTAKLSIREDAMRKVAEAFLESYAKSGERSRIAKARGQRYFGPFSPFLTPGMAKMLRDKLLAYA